jgi:type 1 fimbria pilin
MPATMKKLGLSLLSIRKVLVHQRLKEHMRLHMKNIWAYGVSLACLVLADTAIAQSNVAVSGAIASSTCTVDTSNVAVSMGQFSVQAISAVGVGSPIATFSDGVINLTCENGANVEVAFTDLAGAPAGSQYLNLTPGSGVASGVGIQLFQMPADTPITLQSGYFQGTNVPTGAFSVPFRARYYRTASAVTAGTANASAMFVFTYP